jgi:hypothetical protein
MFVQKRKKKKRKKKFLHQGRILKKKKRTQKKKKKDKKKPQKPTPDAIPHQIRPNRYQNDRHIPAHPTVPHTPPQPRTRVRDDRHRLARDPPPKGHILAG